MKHFLIYQKAYLSLKEQEDSGLHKKFIAIPAEQLKTGLYSPHAHPELSHDPVAEVDAKDAAAAVKVYEEKRANMNF